MNETKIRLKYFFAPEITITLLLAIVVFFNTIYNSFHYDDIGVAIKSDYVEGELSDFWNKTTNIFMHRLFLLYSFALNYHWGDGSVASYHIVNITFHIFNALLIYLILKSIIDQSLLLNKSKKLSKNSAIIPFLSSLIFALQPLNTETVTFISSRSSGMATFFFLLSLYFFIEGTKAMRCLEKPSNIAGIIFYFFSLSAFIFGLGTKEITATLPAIMFLYLYYFERDEKNILNFLLQFKWFFLIIISPATLYLAYRKITSGEIFTAQADAGMSIYGRYFYFITELKVIIFYYLKLFIFPINLNIYPTMSVSTSIFDPMVIISLLIVFCLVAFATLSSLKKKQTLLSKIICFGILWFFITLLPSSSFIPLLDLVSEHRSYLPAAGASIVFGAILFVFIDSFNRRVNFKLVKIFPVISILLFFSLLTVKRNAIWKDEFTLWKDSAFKTPNNIKPHLNLGVEYIKRGEKELALREFKTAIRIFPEHYEPHYNLGIVYSDLKLYNKAIPEFINSIRLNAPFASVKNYLTFFALGNAYSKTGEYDKAIDAYFKSDQIFYKNFDKNYIKAINNSGEVYGKMGLLDEAIKQFKKVLKINPNHILANENLARGYQYKGNYDKANYYFNKARRLKKKE